MFRVGAALLALVGGLLVAAPDASAAPFNVRPTTVEAGPETALGTIFTHGTDGNSGVADNGQMTNAFTVNGVGSEQSPVALWLPAAASAGSTIIIEIAGFASSNKMGIYSAASGTLVQLFDGSASSDATVTFEFTVGGTVKVNGVDKGLFSLVDGFGFYISTPQSNTFYTEDSDNTGGNPQAVVFQGGAAGRSIYVDGSYMTLGATDWVIAFEDVAYASGSDHDFNDFVFVASGLQATPEPSTILLLSGALAGLGGAVVRRRRRASAQV
jgi:hypothetical protein